MHININLTEDEFENSPLVIALREAELNRDRAIALQWTAELKDFRKFHELAKTACAAADAARLAVYRAKLAYPEYWEHPKYWAALTAP